MNQFFRRKKREEREDKEKVEQFFIECKELCQKYGVKLLPVLDYTPEGPLIKINIVRKTNG